MAPFLYALLTTALYYLGSRALITRHLWQVYPRWLDRFMLCAACTGFWYGVIVALGVGWYLDVPFLLLPGRFWLTPVVVGLCSIIWTPVIAAVHLWALDRTAAEPITEPEESNAAAKK